MDSTRPNREAVWAFLAFLAALEGTSLPVRALLAQGGMVEPLGWWWFVVLLSVAVMSYWHLVGHQGVRKSPY